jgi:enoyl-CoA hydratase/carnithine racemase
VGYSQARRLTVCGGPIDAALALQVGLVHQQHDAATIGLALEAALASILRGVPGAIASAKSLLAQSRVAAPSVMVSAAADAFSRSAAGPEGQEGAAAHAEQRAPRWALAATP